MRKMWKRLMAVVCTASMLVAMPGISVPADELQEKYAESVLENPDQTMEDAFAPGVEPEEVASEPEIDEEVVGDGDVTVGDGVTASFSTTTGGVVFYSDGGTLSKDWYKLLHDQLGSSINKERIKSIRVASGKVYLPADSSYLFTSLQYMTSFDAAGFDTSNVINMNNMFHTCTHLTRLDLSSFDTTSVTDMGEMFFFCTDLEDLNLKNFNTSSVTNMSGMFSYCGALTRLDLSSFNTSNVTTMADMFNTCRSIKSLDLSSFNTSNVTDMCQMFNECKALTDLNLSSFNTSGVTNMYNMFGSCKSITNLNLSSFDTSGVIYMDSMFTMSDHLISLDLSNFDTSNVADMSNMFGFCSNLEDVNLSSFNTSNVTDMNYMFAGCYRLKELDLSNFNTSKVSDMRYMFYYCTDLTAVDLSSFETEAVTKAGHMFDNCNSLTVLDLSSFDTSAFEDTQLLTGCKYLSVLETPKNNTITGIALPYDLYSVDGDSFSSLPIASESMVLARTPEMALDYASKRDIANATITGVNSSYAYTGKPIEPTITVTFDGKTLKEGSDYSVEYISNVNVGTATIKVKGIKFYNGETSVTFTIQKEATAGFTDVQDPTHPYYKAIYWAADAGITKGYPDGTFGIDKSCTRGEMIMFLWRFAGKPAPKAASKSPFKDVPTSHTFYKAVLWAYQTGVTKGYGDGTFGVNRNVSRGECMMFLWRIKGKPAPTPTSKSPFKDVPTSHAFYKAILWGFQKGITKGYTSGPKKGKFGINENCTRGQIVTFLYRAK